MSKTAIRLFFNNGNTETIKHIDCGSSSPYLKGDIRLNTFIGLTAFDGGDNGLEAVTGFSQLTALKRFEIVGANTVSFNISSLPVNLQYFDLRGSNTTSGNISALPTGLTYYTNLGSNTTSGNISALPSGLTTYQNYGTNTTSGNIGNLPNNLTNFTNTGSNTTSGDISTLPSVLTLYNNTGSNTTSGDIGMLPVNLLSFSNRGSNTTTGNLSTLPSGLNFYDNSGNNTVYSYYNGEISGYRKRIWANSQDVWRLVPALSSGVPGMPDTHLATLLVDLSGVTWTGNRSFTANVKNPTLSSNQPYWSKVQAAINAIRSQGVTVAVLTAQV